MFYGFFPLVMPTPAQAGTGFNLGTNGAKKITLDNKVNTNEIKFLSEAPLEIIKGSASSVKGTFNFDPQNIEGTAGEIIIQVKSMNTGVALRDTHMSGEEWLDEARFPAITFKITSLSDVKITTTDASAGRGVATGVAKGSFTLHGVSKEMSIPITLTYVKESAATKQRAPGDFVFVQGKFNVNWKEHGVKGKNSAAGKVNENISIDANFFGANGL
jgi:polyisoprenoid-binding protein YceI